MEAYSLILKNTVVTTKQPLPLISSFTCRHTCMHAGMQARRHEPVLVRHHFKRNIRIGGFTEDSRTQKNMVLCSSGKRLAVKYTDQLPIASWALDSILPLTLQIHCNSEQALALLYSERLRKVTPARLMAEGFCVF